MVLGGINLSILGDRLREERERRGWSQVYVAEKVLKMKRSSTYANWEYGIREPDMEMLTKLADLYECSSDYLLGRTNDKHHSSIDAIDLSNEKALIDSKMYYEGMELTTDEKKDFLAIAKGILSAKRVQREK